MSNKNTYCYSQGELLDRPNDYSFSKFHGKIFLLDWEERRRKCIATDIEDGIHPDSEAHPSQTKIYLDNYIDKISEGGILEIESEEFDLLVKNFEVKKKIYQRYGPGFNSKNREDFRDLGLYLLFCDALSLTYEKFNELNILNALLKCIDILCAYIDLLSAPQRDLLNNIIRIEAKFVRSLMFLIKST